MHFAQGLATPSSTTRSLRALRAGRELGLDLPLSENPGGACAQIGGSAAMPFGWIGQTVLMAERRGTRVRQLLADIGVNSEISPETPLDPLSLCLIWTAVAKEMGDELYGATLNAVTPGTTSMSCKVMASESDLTNAVKIVASFFQMIGAPCEIELSTAGGDARLDIQCNSRPGYPAHISEELTAYLLQAQFSYLVGSPLPMSKFATLSDEHPFLYLTHPHLLCPVIKGHTTALHFPASHLCLLRRADHEKFSLWAVQKFWLQHHPAMRDSGIAWEHPGVAGSVFGRLQNANLPIEECSAELFLSVAELRRILKSEGTNFRELRRTAIISRASDYLASGLPTEDVAAVLGYSDGRSFRRALKLAGGESIKRLRSHASHFEMSSKLTLLKKLHG